MQKSERILQRTSLGKILAWIVAKQLKARYRFLHPRDVQHLHSAVARFPRVTIFSSHTTEYDSSALDLHIRTTLGNNRFPVFVARDDISIHLAKNWYLPLSLSQNLNTRHLRLIALDQTNSRGIFRIMPQVETAYNTGHVVIIFPGGTRFQGAVNGLIPHSVTAFTAHLHRRRLLSGHCYLPVGITYDAARSSASLAYGSPLVLDEGVDFRNIGQQVLEAIAVLVGVSTQDMSSAEEVRTFIKSRNA